VKSEEKNGKQGEKGGRERGNKGVRKEKKRKHSWEFVSALWRD
jgi:hypothetical protein